MAKSKPPARSQHPDWKRAYNDVLGENDTATLFRLVEVAEPAIRTQLDTLAGGPHYHVEREALKDALYRLKVLKMDRLKFGAA